jgi:hypothetical protein
MVERGERLSLARETGEALRILREQVREDLDGDVAIEPRIAGAIHLSHAAGADGGQDFARAETST